MSEQDTSMTAAPGGGRRRFLTPERLLPLIVTLLLIGTLIALWVNEQRSDASGSAGVVMTGKAAPDFALPGLNGGTIRLSDYQGDVVLVNFWATWCPPCRAEMPEIEAVYRTHSDDGLTVIGVDQAESADVVRPYIQERGFSWTFALDQDGDVSRRYGVYGIPQSYLIDRDGNVAYMWAGPLTRRDLEMQLEKLGVE